MKTHFSVKVHLIRQSGKIVYSYRWVGVILVGRRKLAGRADTGWCHGEEIMNDSF